MSKIGPFEDYYEARGDGCHVWRGPMDNDGYGRYRGKAAHRYAYTQTIGPIPKGLVIDHICRTRSCVNPAHLRLLTSAENVMVGEGVTAKNARKTHCPRGHALSGANVYFTPKGWRQCRECRRAVRRREIMRRRNDTEIPSMDELVESRPYARPKSEAVKEAWETRKRRYGPAGCAKCRTIAPGA